MPLSIVKRSELEAAFEEFASQAWPMLVRSAVLMGADHHAAQDAAQVALTSCYRRWRKVEKFATSPRAYAYRCLVNELSRSKFAREIPTESMPKTCDVAASPEVGASDEAVVRAALMTLPVHQRAVLVCTYYLDLPDAQAAEVLQVPIGTVKSRRSRALDALAADHELSELAFR